MTDFDCHAATELDLYARNFSGVHYNSVGKRLSKFHQRGDFNYERAVKYIERNLVMPAAKDYLLLTRCDDSIPTRYLPQIYALVCI